VVAVVVLAALVFGVTFAMNYLGGWFGADSTTTPTQEARGLTFSYTNANLAQNPRLEPQLAERTPLEWEEKQPGWYDFWFHNENTEEVPLGLGKVGCGRCSSVEAYALKPAGRGGRPVGAGEGGVVGAVRGASRWGGLPQAFLAALGYQGSLRRAQAEAEGTGLMDKEVLRVPGGAAGWVRLKWENAELGQPPLSA